MEEEGGPLEFLLVLNLRLRSLVGSMREVQSDWEGGTSIHSSRWGFWDAEWAAISWSRFCWRWREVIRGVEPGAGGSEGPKSSSEEVDASSSSASKIGFVGGSLERGAGGGAGPIIRLGASSLEQVNELRGRFGGVGCASSSSSSRLRLA